MRKSICAVILALVGVPVTLPVDAADSAAVTLTKKADTIEARVGGELFTVYNFSRELPKPFFFPLLGPSGKPITRAVPVATGEDHPHQKSLWIAIDEVNEVDFWAEKGKIVNRSVELLTAEGDPAVFRARNEWQDAAGKAVVSETTTVRVHASRRIDLEITFSAGDQGVTFGDTKEGLFGIRVHPQLREDKSSGRITNADAQVTEKGCWGKESAWVDYSGTVDGAAQGVAVFDYPSNFRRVRWHVRGYGLFAANPFGGKAYTGDPKNDGTHKLAAGQSMTLRYAVYVHHGDAQQGKVADQYEAYVKSVR